MFCLQLKVGTIQFYMLWYIYLDLCSFVHIILIFISPSRTHSPLIPHVSHTNPISIQLWSKKSLNFEFDFPVQVTLFIYCMYMECVCMFYNVDCIWLQYSYIPTPLLLHPSSFNTRSPFLITLWYYFLFLLDNFFICDLWEWMRQH